MVEINTDRVFLIIYAYSMIGNLHNAYKINNKNYTILLFLLSCMLLLYLFIFIKYILYIGYANFLIKYKV